MDQLRRYYQKLKYNALVSTLQKEERLEYLLQVIRSSYSKYCINAAGYSYPPNTIWVSINKDCKIENPTEIAAEIKSLDPELINIIIESRADIVVPPTRKSIFHLIYIWWHWAKRCRIIIVSFLTKYHRLLVSLWK
jgi:hypothetical protein